MGPPESGRNYLYVIIFAASSQPAKETMDRLMFTVGCISALISVAAGAFGAHSLRARLSPELLAIFETGARYQMYHALALLAAALAADRWHGPATHIAGWCFVVGTVLFSGSLYILALSGHRWLGAVTPLGGVAFLAGWIALAYGACTR
jgi:uncharacterized membrane protein YgdD (TMEM256/DUF423 family)